MSGSSGGSLFPHQCLQQFLAAPSSASFTCPLTPPPLPLLLSYVPFMLSFVVSALHTSTEWNTDRPKTLQKAKKVKTTSSVATGWAETAD